MKTSRKTVRRRVLFYSHTGLVSGAEHVLINTIRGLDPEVFEAVVLCPPEGDLCSRLHESGSTVFSTPSLNARFTGTPLAFLTYLASFLRVMRSLRRVAHSLRPDIIHANSVRAGIVATIATLGSSTPVIWHIQDDLPKHPISTLIRCLGFVSRRSILVSVSESTARAFSGKLPLKNRSRVLYNGVDLKRFPVKTACPSSYRQLNNIADETFLLCAIGMVNPRKNLLGLLDAFELVYAARPETQLLIVGAPIFNQDGLYLDAVKAHSKHLGLDAVVHFVGPQKDVASILRSCDLLVLNARVEPFGLVIVEAMSSGTPVLATRVGGIPEIITSDKTGYLTPPENYALLAERILEIIANPKQRDAVVQEAHRSVCPRFSLERYNIEYRKLLESCLPSQRSTSALDIKSEHLLCSAIPSSSLKVALFHDNFAQNGGAEKVAETLHVALKNNYSDTHLLTTLTVRERLSSYLLNVPIQNTWMQRLPALSTLFRAYFLIYPHAIDRVDLSEYDLVVTSCFGYAKGVRRRSDALHICYCHTPMRWVWSTDDYLEREVNSQFKKVLLTLPIRWLKSWELSAAARPDIYIANSTVVAKRLFQSFGIHATVIPPPIHTQHFATTGVLPVACESYLILSRLVPYKRLDLAIEACNRTQRSLIVIGAGPDRQRLERMAGPTISFLGRAPDDDVVYHAQHCRALLFPGEEDFGMTPLEVNAAGRPVVAYRGGGATETIVEGLNGVFFDHPSADSLIAAMDHLESMPWDSSAIQDHARQFDVSVFKQRITTFIQQAFLQKQSEASSAAALVTT